MIATEAPGLRVSCTIWRFCSIDRNCRRRTPLPRTSLITLLRTLVVSTRTPHVDTTKCPLPSWAHHVSVWFSGGGGPDTTLTTQGHSGSWSTPRAHVPVSRPDGEPTS